MPHNAGRDPNVLKANMKKANKEHTFRWVNLAVGSGGQLAIRVPGFRSHCIRLMPTLKTGLRMCPAEKRRDSDPFAAEQSVLCSPVCFGNNREIRASFAYCGGRRADFLCCSDCVAEREGFEPSVQVLARTTV